MLGSVVMPEFDLYVWEGRADFLAQVERVFFDSPARIVAAETAGVVLSSMGQRPVVALVSVTVLADGSFHALDWLSANAVPVIWVAAASNYRQHSPQYFPPAHSHTLPAEFSHAALRNMVLSLLQEVELSVAAPQPVSGGAARRDELIAVSAPMRALLSEAKMLAGCDANVMIYGETGVGKERIARYLHEHSARHAGPFVAVNCGAIPENLFESEFFGHVKGAFTGALTTRKGYFEQAFGGTLFLDEIGELPLPQQVKLLRVLESRRVMRVGAVLEVELDFRLVAATNRDLVDLVRSGEFRADLYYRLAVIELQVPSLEARGEAAKAELFRQLMARYLQAADIEDQAPEWIVLRISQTVFPGNVRELMNVVERLGLLRLVLGRWDVGRAELVFERMQRLGCIPSAMYEAEGHVPADGRADSDVSERAQIVEALMQHGWRRQDTAAFLGISRKALWEKMRKLQIQAG